MKRIARGVGIRLACLPVALWTADCVLEPSGRGPAQRRTDDGPGELVPPAVDADPVLEWHKDIDRIRVEAHSVPLRVPGFPDAVVAEPLDSTARRPVVVVLHGLHDRPEPHCEAWRTITAREDFVVCLRGGDDTARSDPDRRRYTLAGGATLVAHVDAALASLVAAYGNRVDPVQPLLVGFSLGATEAALLAQHDPGRFPRVAIVEGGLDVWGETTIEPFASGGARRVLFGCGSAWCPVPASAAAQRMGVFGVESRVAFADVGHHDAPPLQQAMKDQFAWLVAGDARWDSAEAAGLALAQLP